MGLRVFVVVGLQYHKEERARGFVMLGSVVGGVTTRRTNADVVTKGKTRVSKNTRCSHASSAGNQTAQTHRGKRACYVVR